MSRLSILLSLFCLLLSHLPAQAAPTGQRPEPSYTVGDCRTAERQALRSEVEAAALHALIDPITSIDIPTLVDRKWIELGVDEVIDGEVARAVATLAAQEDYLSLFWSGWWAEKAEEYAGRIADDAFGSPAFTAKMDEIAQAIGTEVARTIDAEFTRAASAAFLCLQAYVGEAYAAVLFEAFQNSVDAQVKEADITIDPTALSLSVFDTHQAGLAGVSLIVIVEVGRRVSQKIGEKIAQRIAGKVLGRVVGRAGSSFLPVVGWVVGIGLLVWDLYEGAKGSLPQIEEALTSEDVKERIRGEIADAVAAGLPEETSIAALEIAVTLVEEWDAFCDERYDLCQQAAANPGLRSLLDSTPLAELDRLDALVRIFVNEMGRSQLNRAIEIGALDVLLAEPAATTVLTTTHSLTATLAWVNLAGENLAGVVDLSVARQAQPDEFDAPRLQRLLALDDAEAVRRVLALDAGETAALLTWPIEALKRLASELTTEELAWLVDYLASKPQIAAPLSASNLITDLASGKVTLVQVQADATPPPPPLTPTPPPTPTLPTPTSPTSPAPALDENSSSGLIITLLLVVLGAAVILFLMWRRRKEMV